MSIAFKIDEDHNGTGQEKIDEMLNKEPLPLIKKGDAAFCNSQNITKEKLQKFMPKGTSSNVTEDIVKIIHNIENDTGVSQEYAEEQVMSCMGLLGKQGVTLEKLVNAVKFCCLKRHYDNKKSWAIVFPKKYDELVANGKYIDSHVSEYNSTYCVVEVDKMMMVPFYLQYNHLKHEALMTQAKLMRGIGAKENDYVSPHVQHLASKTVYEMLKSPEDNTIELKVGASDALIEQHREMNENIAKLVAQQASGFRQGLNTADIQKVHIKKSDDIIDVDLKDDDEDEDDE